MPVSRRFGRQRPLLTTAQCDRALVLGVETFQECAELYTTGRWLLGTPLLEAAACLVLERHPSLAAVRYRAERGTRGLARLVAGERREPWRACISAPQRRMPGRWRANTCKRNGRTMSLVLLHERLGICLACAPLIALMLAVTAGQPEDVLLISQWWDAWTMVRWPGPSSQAGH